MAGLFGSITIKGNRLTEFAAQTATVGIPIPFGYGQFPCEGNVIFAALPPKEHVKKKKQGKGGVKSEEYSYTLSYAVAFCEGPIFGFLTIKRDGKIVWTQDPNASVADKAYAQKWAQKATFYYGTETQLPDSTIESYKGAGQVSAHRGLAYIVLEDDDVTSGGGAVPTYEAVVIASPPDVYLTSKPYRLEHIEGVGASQFTTRLAYQMTPPADHLDAKNVTALPGTQREIIQRFTAPTESVDVFQPTALAGTLREVLQRLTAPSEGVNAYMPTTLTGTHVETVIRYQNWPSEGVDGLAFNPLNGTLT